MATRNTARKLQDLIEEAARLEALAPLVQADDEAAGLAAAKDLASAYRGWYASAIGLIPEDLRERFRREYEKGFPEYKIKYFLESPRKKNPMYQDDLSGPSKEIFKFWQFPYSDRFIAPLNQQMHYLEEALARCGAAPEAEEALELLEQIARRLPVTISILATGNRNNKGISIRGEYDVQYILHSIVVLLFAEVEPEEPTPKMAGASSRLDFLLKQERVAIETKMMRDSLTIRNLRKDLAEDIVYFRSHPDVTSLFILVYDPQRRITNAVGFENELRSDSDDFIVRTVVVS